MALARLAEVTGDFLAVGFERITADQNHALLCVRDGAAAQIIELRFHHEAVAGAFRGRVHLAVVDVDPLRLPAAFALLRDIVRNAGKRIPFGLGYPHDCFDAATGDWLLGETGPGLTCATFVIASLAALGFELIKLDEWPVRPEDAAWRRVVAGILEEHQHFEQARWVRENEACARFRPEEVAGAALESIQTWPVSFEQAARRAADVLQAAA